MQPRRFSRVLLPLVAMGLGVDIMAAVVTEPPGPSSRRTGLVVTEIMYNPASRTDGRKLEFLELYNSNPFPEDLTGLQLTDDISFVFPSGTVLGGGSYLVVARAPGDMQAVYGVTNVVGGYVGKLSPSGSLRLRDRTGAVLLSLAWANHAPWPVAPDGAGHSLVLTRPSLGEADPAAWAASDSVGGSPGRADPVTNDPLRAVVINEFLANSEAPDLDYIELFNTGNQDVDIASCVLSDDPKINKFVFPPGSVIPARGFFALDEYILGFGLDLHGETIYFRNTNNTRVLEAVRFADQARGVAQGRFPDGAPGFRELSVPTPWAANAPSIRRDVVINEIMYAPISGDLEEQFIELYNRGAGEADLSGWRFTAGISFPLPAGTRIPGGGYLVVAKNAARLRALHPQLNAANTVGDWTNNLSRAGGRIELTRIERVTTTNNLGVAVTNSYFSLADAMSYTTGSRYSRWANGGGSSLELTDARADPLLAANWADSDERDKATWTTIEVTGVLDLGSGPANRLEVVLLGAGECLIDDVEVRPGVNGANLIANSNFESSDDGWVTQGNHTRSSREAGDGFNSAGSFHLRASGGGDTGANRVRTALTSALSPGQTATIRAKVRWLCGTPEIVLRLSGNYLEAAGRMTLPADLGTPGLPNSRAVSNAPPAISEMQHQPVLPAAGQPVIITARVQDPDGVTAVWLRYRIDPGTEVVTVAMLDDGVGGDAIANDGVYSATLPGFPAGTLVAYHVEASDGSPAALVRMFPPAAPVQEGLMRFGEPAPAGGFGTYRLWLTEQALQTWINRPALSTEPVDCTFVSGDSRVIYNAKAWYAADPFHQGVGSPMSNGNYVITFPSDDKFLGATRLDELHAPGYSEFDDNTLQREQTANAMARQFSLPSNYRRYVAVYVNGARRGTLMEDGQLPGSDTVEEWFPADAVSDLFLAQGWFEFDDQGVGFTPAGGPTLNRFTTIGGAFKPAQYRWNFSPVAVDGPASTYSNFFALINAASTPAGPLFAPQLSAAVNVEQWMQVLALEHALGNGESFGRNLSANVAFAKPAGDRWQLLPGAMRRVLGAAGSFGPTGDDLFAMETTDTNLFKVFHEPAFRRIYWRALKDIAVGPMDAASLAPWLYARHAAFLASGVNVQAPFVITNWMAARWSYILSQLPAASFAVQTPAIVTTTSNLVTLTGIAPIEAVNIVVNGQFQPVTWTSDTNWSIRLVVTIPASVLSVRAVDVAGNPVGDGSVIVNYSGPSPPPPDQVVINEIMYHAGAPGAEFIELFNVSSTFTADLGSWRLDELGIYFAPGTILLPRQFVVVVANRGVFAATYGSTVPVAGEYGIPLKRSAGTLTLFNAGGGAVDKLRYENISPWPLMADGAGASLQLIDVAQDNSRVGNWAASSPTLGKANAVATPLPPFPPLWLNEVQPQNVTGLTDNSDEHEPWVELFNSGQSQLSLDGLFLSNDYADLTHWSFPNGSFLQPGERRVIWCDGDPAQSTTNEWHTNFRLGPTGSVALVRLVNGSSQVMDYLNYAADADLSYGSFPEAQPFDRYVLRAATPGGSNAAPALFINEWMASNSRTLSNPVDGQPSDWFELYNGSATAFDLSGFYLSDHSTVRSRIPDGTMIPGRGYLLFWADGDASRNRPGHPDLHAAFALKRSGDGISLYVRDRVTAIDTVAFNTQVTDVSDGRYPDGGTPYIRLTQPTPGAANVLSWLSAAEISNVTMFAGQTLGFTVAADNHTVPPQSLVYSLTGAPSGATLNSTNGAFWWTAPLALAPSTNTITVRVCASTGAPCQERSFVVTTLPPPPRFVGITKLPNGSLSLAWQGNAGRSYRAEFKNSLGDPVWTPLGNPEVANPGLLFTDFSPPAAQRFYRVTQLD